MRKAKDWGNVGQNGASESDHNHRDRFKFMGSRDIRDWHFVTFGWNDEQQVRRTTLDPVSDKLYHVP